MVVVVVVVVGGGGAGAGDVGDGGAGAGAGGGGGGGGGRLAVGGWRSAVVVGRCWLRCLLFGHFRFSHPATASNRTATKKLAPPRNNKMCFQFELGASSESEGSMHLIFPFSN